MDYKTTMAIETMRRNLEAQGAAFRDKFNELLVEADMFWKCPDPKCSVLTEPPQRTCQQCGQPKPLLPGEPSDEWLDEEIDEYWDLFDLYDDDTLRRLCTLIGTADVFTALGVSDVTMYADTIEPADTVLTLTFALGDTAFRLCTQPLEPRELVDESLNGAEQARAAVKAAYDLVSATLDDFHGLYAPVTADERPDLA